jgi:hypothetical protein
MEFFGFIHRAADREAAAVAEFGLNDEQVKLLVLQEIP